jgi:ABC-type antimicrobial peptide transport system permease subunit
LRTTLAQRWTGYLTIIVPVGLLGGVAMGSIAAARRTQAAFPTFLASTNPSNLTLVTSGWEPGQPNSVGGALLPASLIPNSVSNVNNVTPYGPSAILVRLRSGSNRAASLAGLRRIAHQMTLPTNYGVGELPVQRPAEIINYRSMGTIPAILGLGLAAGAVTALCLTLLASVRRRRRDLALLKTVGFTRRQLAATVACQASVAVGIGTVVGIPIGIVVGRSLWDVFAQQIDAVAEPFVPALTIVGICVGPHHFVKTETAAQRFNAAFCRKITVLVGTMWCAYPFALIAFVSLPSTTKQHSATVIVLWLSSEFIQLVQSPIIIVGQNIQSRAADARATKTFEDVGDARKKIEQAIDLLDVNTEGGLHDAVALIVGAINTESLVGGAAT